MSLTPGTRIGSYEVTAQLGVGGMGEVYRATDPRLKRDVAIKVLPAALASDPERLARFQREAEVLASLNHPNIAAIHGLEESGGTKALVLELVEGPTLADRIAQGPLPLAEALQIARQIADGLEAAHDRGVVHRDLKPGNVKLRPDGTVKVLDFGLAKAYETTESRDQSLSPTLTTPAQTLQGVIMGTAAYMSPEQAGGGDVDQRSDIWSFGVVLYEMLTGRQLFGGESVARVIAKVLERHLDFGALPPGTPAPVRRLLRRCLERDPRRRLRHIADARAEVEEALAGGEAEAPMPAVTSEPAARSRMATAAWAAGALLVGAGLAIGAGRVLSPPVAPHPLVRFSIAPGNDALANNPAGAPILALSPDGRTLVHGEGLLQQRRLFRRDMAFLEVQPIPGTEGVQANTPFFSPDGQWVGWASGAPGGVALRRVSLGGGPAAPIVEEPMIRGVSWGPDDMIVYGSEEGVGLRRVAVTGGTPEDLTTPAEGEIGHYRPDVLPDGNGVLFTIWTGSVDTSRIAVLDMSSREYRPLTSGTYPRYVSSGHVVFARTNSLWAIPFDAEALEATGPAVPMIDGVDVEATGVAQFAVSRDGTLVYAPTGNSGGGETRTLVWVTREGAQEPLAAPPRAYFDPVLSPDGTRAAVSIADGANRDIWVWQFASETLTRLTFDAALDMSPLWTPDGSRIVFWSGRDGGGIFSKAADGTGTEDRLLAATGGRILAPSSWAPDGSLLFQTDGVSDVGLVSFGGAEPEVAMLLDSSANEWSPHVSADGRWLAYVSNESTQDEVYVRPFPEVDGGKWQVTSSLNDGGSGWVTWSSDGRTLLFANLASASMYAADVRAEGRTFATGTPRALFNISGLFFAVGSWNNVAPAPGDGGLLMMSLGAGPAGGSGPQDLISVLNWAEELTRLAPGR
jgi:serine/threonine-protein kinase